jgi:hypothetical protein
MNTLVLQSLLRIEHARQPLKYHLNNQGTTQRASYLV